jgi:CheY-like chemotaxis protein
MHNPPPPPFGFLYRTIRILIVEDDPYFIKVYRTVLSGYPFYEITVVENATEAEERILQAPGFSVCLLDLGITDRQQDEFYLLRRYASRLSFLVVSGADSPQKGSIAFALGAREAIQKKGIAQMHLIERINRVFLESIAIPYAARKDDTIIAAANALFENAPDKVRAWVRTCSVDEGRLRRRYIRYGEHYKPVHILSLVKMYSAAFSSLVKDKDLEDTARHVRYSYTVHDVNLERLQRFYESNKDAVDALRYG